MKDKTLKQLVESIKASSQPKTSAYDTSATVTRIENGVAWVHIPGGVRETPVKLTINAKAGDNVQVRVSGGRAFMVGNATAPPTDDKTAQMASKAARTAHATAVDAGKTANTAKAIATDTSANLINVKTAYEDDIYGDSYYQYTTGGVTYDVWKSEDGKYYYDNGSGTDQEVDPADLDRDADGYITVRHGGLQDSVEKISGAVMVDEVEPSVTIQAAHTTQSGTRTAGIKITDQRVSFKKNGEEVAYIDSDEGEGVIDINNARVHVSLRIGHLELFDHNGGIGVRRYE